MRKTSRATSGVVRSEESAEPLYPIESVDRVLRLLSLFGDSEAVDLTRASSTLGVSKSTAHRIFAMLEYHGFVQQASTRGAFAVGPALRQIGLAAIRPVDLRSTARPFMENLSREVGETVYLVIREHFAAVFIETVESTNELRLASRNGTRMDVVESAVGKIILAYLPEPELMKLFPHDHISAAHRRAKHTRKELLSSLQRNRERGYDANFGTAVPEISAIAVAVLDGTGYPRASLAIGAPSFRLKESNSAPFLKALKLTAAELGSLL